MRLISEQANLILDGNRNAPANFGLLFNKWLEYQDGTLKPAAQGNKQSLIDSYKRSTREMALILKNRHLSQSAYCTSMEKVGWRSFVFVAELCSPFISGLGMTHPTETGMVLDHISGAPYIPVASQKGVMRLAHIINSLMDDNGKWRDIESLLDAGIVEKKTNKAGEKEDIWREDDSSKTLFGFSEKDKSLAGQMVVLDAYPMEPPELSEEILNPHFRNYYSGERGPTEDQSPNPIKFMVVRPGARFVFRILLRPPLANAPESDQELLTAIITKNIRRAVEEEGMGAKTALGFGRFQVKTAQEPALVEKWQCERDKILRPWLGVIEAVTRCEDWGQLKTFLEQEDAVKWKAYWEVGEKVKETAERVRNSHLKKWQKERDKKIADWLELTGTTWHSLTKIGVSGKEQDATPSSPILEKIRGYSNWGIYKNDPVDITTLDKTALQALQQQFKKWGCNAKKAKKDKSAAWKSLNKCLRQK